MTDAVSPIEAEAVLTELASVFLQNPGKNPILLDAPPPNVETRYRALVEQIPAVVFMAYIDQGISEAYVSPQIEKMLGFTQSEWLEDPVRWYHQIHPEDKDRWSLEAAQMFLSGQPLKSAYRVLARDGHVIWFQCEAKMIRRSDGRPWFIHGVAFDITSLKRAERILAEERNLLSAILDTVGALVAVLDADGRIVQFNRACEQATGYQFAEVEGKPLSDLFLGPEDAKYFRSMLDDLVANGAQARDYESQLLTRGTERRLINWSTTVLPAADGKAGYVIATGIDITERKRLERAVLEVSNSEQRRIGQDLHDGLGQHLTGVAFLSKALEERLADRSLPEAKDAAKIVKLVNEGIQKTRQLARGLLPVSTDSLGLMSALEHWAAEVADLFRISCRFECDDPVLVRDATATNHLYRIAQEAVNNAVRHGHAKNIVLQLTELDGSGCLRILDDGSGFRQPRTNQQGMGLHIMHYRASMIGGTLEITQVPEHGTLVTCIFPN